MAALRPRDIRETWDYLRPRVEQARLKGGGDWRPEDVYAACLSGAAHLWMCDEGAFCILQLERNTFTNDLELFVWVAWTPGTHPLREYFEQVRGIARDAGAVRMRMLSKRRGWGRVDFWHPGAVEYMSEV